MKKTSVIAELDRKIELTKNQINERNDKNDFMSIYLTACLNTYFEIRSDVKYRIK